MFQNGIQDPGLGIVAVENDMQLAIARRICGRLGIDKSGDREDECQNKDIFHVFLCKSTIIERPFPNPESTIQAKCSKIAFERRLGVCCESSVWDEM